MKLSPSNPRRRAIASMEYVMVFPFLLGLVCMLYAIARADISKLAAATVSRRQTWLTADQTNSSKPLAPVQNLRGDQVGPPGQVPAPLGPMFGNRVDQATSITTTLADTWGFSSVPFDSLPQNCQPHTDVVKKIPSDFIPPDVVSAAFLPLYAFDPTNPVLTVGATIMGFGNIAVQVAGEVLDGGGAVGAFFDAAKDAIDAAVWAADHTPIGGIINGITGGGIDKLKDLLKKVIDALDVFHNLNEAAHGRPGSWSPPPVE